MSDAQARQIALYICLAASLFMLQILRSSVSAGEAVYQTATIVQQVSPLSPLAMAQNQPATVAKEQLSEQIPAISGSQANQTSLVLIVSVLLGLVIIGTLIVSRRE